MDVDAEHLLERVRNKRVSHARDGPDDRSIGQEEQSSEQVAIAAGGPSVDQREDVHPVAEVD